MLAEVSREFSKLPKPLYFLYAGTIVTRMGAFVFPYLTIYLSEVRDFGLDVVGLVLSVGSIGLLLGNLLGGWLTDRWSRKWTLIFALLLNALGFGALAFHYPAGWMYASFLFVGYLGSGMYNPAANTVISDLTEENKRQFAYTVNYVCVNVGMALGPLLGGFLATVSYLWIFVGDVITSLVCASLICIGVAETKHQLVKAEVSANEKKKPQPRLVWLRHPLVFLFCLIYFFLICPLMGLEFAVPLLVKKAFSSSEVFIGVIYTINAVCILSLSFFVEKFIRGKSEIRWMIVAGCFWAAGLMILLFGYSILALMICTAVWTIGEIIASIIVPTYISNRVSADVKGRFLALNDVVRSFSGVICPIGLGFLWKYSGPERCVQVLTLLPLVAIAWYLGIWVFGGPENARPQADTSLTRKESELALDD